jgi:hypothetical protein
MTVLRWVLKSILCVLLIIGSFAGGAAEAEEEGDTSDWAVCVSHSSGSTVMLIEDQMLVLVWKLDSVAVEAEMAFYGEDTQQLQVGLFLNGEFVSVQDVPNLSKGDVLLQFNLDFPMYESGGFARVQLYVSKPDGPVRGITRPLELRIHKMRPSEYSAILEKLKEEEDDDARESDASACPDAHHFDDIGGDCPPFAAARREKAGVFSPWDSPDDVVALRRALDDVNLQVFRTNPSGWRTLSGAVLQGYLVHQ